jgi:hypothetical protein
MKKFSIEWCPTKKTVDNFMTKPLQGSHFRSLRYYIMGRAHSIKPKNNVIIVGRRTNKKIIEKSKVNGKRLTMTATGSKCCVKV